MRQLCHTGHGHHIGGLTHGQHRWGHPTVLFNTAYFLVSAQHRAYICVWLLRRFLPFSNCIGRGNGLYLSGWAASFGELVLKLKGVLGDTRAYNKPATGWLSFVFNLDVWVRVEWRDKEVALNRKSELH